MKKAVESINQNHHAGIRSPYAASGDLAKAPISFNGEIRLVNTQSGETQKLEVKGYTSSRSLSCFLESGRTRAAGIVTSKRRRTWK